jgi:uncharacterized cupin superfamily protein
MIGCFLLPISQAFLLQSEERRGVESIVSFGERISLKLSGADCNGGCTIFENVTPPKAGPPLHRHSRQDEWFYILEGDYLFEVEGKQMTAGPGCSAFAPRGTAHTFQNLSSSPSRMIVVSQPAGMDMFFNELSAAMKDMREPDMSVLMPIFEKHGIEFLGPPLAARAKATTESAS